MRDRRSGSPVAVQLYGGGLALASEGKPQAEQEKYYAQAIESDPQFIAPYDTLAATLASEGKWAEAEKTAREALKLNSNDVGAHRVRAAVFWTHRDLEQAERELKRLIELDPEDATAFAHLGYIYCEKGRKPDAIAYYEIAAQLDPHGSDAAFVHAQLGCIYAQQGDREKAVAELQASEREVSPADILTEYSLAGAYIALNQTPPALEHGARFMVLARKSGAPPDELEAIERFLEEAKHKLTPSFITNVQPKNYAGRGLRQVLASKLTGAERRLAVSPLESTSEMVQWSRRLTAKATNNLQRANMIFDALTEHVAMDRVIPYSASLTAAEVFAKWRNEPGFIMQCQQATFLFVALARAVGVSAYAVNVYEALDGGRTPHACAAVYASGKALLVDLTYFWFGAPHKQFAVLDDVQALAVHLCMQPDLERNRIAAKLAPDLPLVQYRLCSSLLNAGRWGEAKKLLPDVARLDINGTLAAAVQAAFAMHEGRAALAEEMLRKATEIDPRDPTLYLELGNVYAAEGKFSDARQCFENALRWPHTREEAAFVAQAIVRMSSTGSAGNQTNEQGPMPFEKE
jgi:tetratricopeptide (TPR) repeat protein